MTSPIAPADEAELAAVVADAAAKKTPLAIAGAGTRTGLGRPVQAAATLSTARLTGVTLYEPHELVLSARAGTPLSEIETLLRDNRQRLAFERRRKRIGEARRLGADDVADQQLHHDLGVSRPMSLITPTR